MKRQQESDKCLTLAVESMESWSTGVTVISSEAQFADAGPGLRVWSAGVVHSTGCAALTVCTDQIVSLLSADIKTFQQKQSGKKQLHLLMISPAGLASPLLLLSVGYVAMAERKT